MTDLVISAGTKVTLHFSLSLENGDVIDSNFENDAVTFVIGDGNLLPGFEKQLLGLVAPCSETYTILPEDAFGFPKDGNIQTLKLKSFGEGISLEVGLIVGFNDASGTEVPGIIKEINGDDVVVDFNHPLAGRPIIFKVDILAVEPTVTH